MKKHFDPGLYLIADAAICAGRDLLAMVLSAVAGGVSLVQLRDKTGNTRDIVALAKALHEQLKPLRVPLVINDRADIALACQLDGVHLGQHDLSPQNARQLLGREAIIGLSIDAPEQLPAAENLPVDYYGVGPVFPTSTKRDAAAPWGIQTLKKIRSQTSQPLVAIGGINTDNAVTVLNTGVAGIAVASAICQAADPKYTANKLRQMIGGAGS